MTEKPKPTNAITPGMRVEATQGDLGEEDVSKPTVVEVIKDHGGNIEKVVIQKGIIFQKYLEVPAERIESVKPQEQDEEEGKVIVATDAHEVETLTAIGQECLAPLEDTDTLLDTVEKTIPSTEGLRKMENHANTSHLAQPVSPWLKPSEQQSIEPRTGLLAKPWLRLLGPGLLAGMAGNDASAVTAYAIDGAQNGFGHLWLLLLSTPLYQAVQYSCAKLGRVTQKGLTDILREHYGRHVAILASLVLVVANIALIAADLVAIGSGLELLTGLSWIWFVVPVGATLWYLTVFRNFETIKKIFLVMSLVCVVYIVTAVLAKPDWGLVLVNTWVPHMSFSFASISSALALLGATISPYNMFWQVQGEKEEVRSGTRKQMMRFASLDIGVGVISGNLIAYCIILLTAVTLSPHHKEISTAADAAQALVPLLGPFAKDLFAVGFIGAGLVAIPVLLASTSYAVAGTFGWPAGLSKKPWQNEGFYLILTGALIISLAMALVHLDPIKLIFWANVLSGVLAPILVIYLLVLGNSRKVMHDQRLSAMTNLGLIITCFIMTIATLLLFYGFATGQAG